MKPGVGGGAGRKRRLGEAGIGEGEEDEAVACSQSSIRQSHKSGATEALKARVKQAKVVASEGRGPGSGRTTRGSKEGKEGGGQPTPQTRQKRGAIK